MKTKILKKLISTICAVCMSVSFAVTSVGAVDKTDVEKFASSLNYLEKVLPKPEDNKFNQFLSLEYLEKPNKLQDEKIYEGVKYPKDEKDNPEVERKDVTIKEKEVYSKIVNLVNELQKKVDERTPSHKDFKGKESKHAKDMPRDMRIAKAIYRWVAKNIPYDMDSLKSGIDLDANSEKVSLRKPQDPLFVFDQHTGVCAGKASLVNLMMRIAKIPCGIVNTNRHAYNVVYLNDNNKEGRKGWTMLDATWGASKSDLEQQIGDKGNIKEDDKLHVFFPGFYNESVDFRQSNINVLKVGEHNIKHVLSCVRDNDSTAELNKDPYYDYYNNYNNIVKNGPIKYCLLGTENGEVLHVDVPQKDLEKGKYAEGFELLPGLLCDGLSVKVNEGIKSFILSGDTCFNFNFRDAEDLESINTEKSSKYISDTIALYERDNSKPNGRGKVIHFFNKKWKTIKDNGLSYSCDVDVKSGELNYISLFGNNGLVTDAVEIPEELRKIKVPIKIGMNIKSLVLKGDDTVDLSDAASLENINVQDSSKYMLENGVLYEKDVDGQKGKKVDMYEPEEVEDCDWF